ncbi:MAG: hypothetical protein SFV51_22070, partial [Bryobacteraceae bacterium]|nr:hypothetical protein [Bryobacteraceae bacterium]
WLFAAWGAVTAVLSLVLIYRATVSMKEEDLLFLDPAEAALASNQQQIQARLGHLAPYVRVLGAASAGLLVAMACVIVYRVAGVIGL